MTAFEHPEADVSGDSENKQQDVSQGARIRTLVSDEVFVGLLACYVVSPNTELVGAMHDLYVPPQKDLHSPPANANPTRFIGLTGGKWPCLQCRVEGTGLAANFDDHDPKRGSRITTARHIGKGVLHLTRSCLRN